ncbi:hypothetical protein [Thermococcus sp.]|uniref:hypothetical protein n=1 Tax=Thermococcus sp. TaxID=35749 RepID=UPI00260D860F|nr:hypothetical protein [Thermococcus sp.]
MESRTLEFPFSADWEAVQWVTSKPVELFRSLPFEGEVTRERPLRARIFLRKRFLRFDFEGSLEVTFADSTATYVMKGLKGLLILSLSVGDNRLVSRASADMVERFLGRKLSELARNFGLAVCRFAESYQRIRGVLLPLGRRKFYVRNLTGEELPHLVRHLRFSTGLRSFEVIGEGERGRFVLRVKDDSVENVEHHNSSGSAIVEVDKPLLDVSEEDFAGLEISGEHRVTLHGL